MVMHHSRSCSESQFSFNRSQLLHSQKNDWTFCAAEYSEIWQFASQLDGHLTEVEDWDLGAGIYIDFLTLKNSFVDTLGPIEELVWCLVAVCDHLLVYNFCLCSAVYNFFVFINFLSRFCGGKIRIPLRKGSSSLDYFLSALRSRKLCGNQNTPMMPGIHQFQDVHIPNLLEFQFLLAFYSGEF